MGKRARKVGVEVTLETEVLREHRDLVTGSVFVEGAARVDLDVRRRNWAQRLGLERGIKVRWADVRQVEIQELSALPWPIRYRLTFGDGFYDGPDGQRHYFALQPHLAGIDLDRGCTEVTLRAAVLMAVIAGVGLRSVCWLMQALFHVGLTKSSLDRWVKACAAVLPDAAGMAKALQADKAITEGHFDEIFPRGQRGPGCTLVLRDEHGRIFAAERVEERTEAVVATFLERVKSWGLAIQTFYVDGCVAYRDAIARVFPGAVLQYDYFHVIQNVFRKLWKVVLRRRRELKRRGETVETEGYAVTLLFLAKSIWEHRWVFFKRDKNLTPEEQTRLVSLMEHDSVLARVREFVLATWRIFDDSKTELAALAALHALKTMPQVQPGTAFAKAAEFLESRFKDMVAYLRHPGVRRNSLAETGMRCLRRLEQGHDGFRGPEGLDAYLRIYQAIKYCGWTVHRLTPGMGLALAMATSPPATQPALVG